MIDYLRNSPVIRTLLLVAMIPLTGSGVDIYAPSLPSITQFFHTSSSMAQLTVPIYLIGYSFAQLFCGTLSDVLGRKKLLLSGIFLYCLMSVASIFAPTIIILLAIRFIQGVAVSAPGVLVRAISSDSFKGNALARTTDCIAIAWATGLIISPVIGAYLQTYFSWQASFYFLAIYSAIILALVALFLPETIMHRQSLSKDVIVNNVKTIITNKLFVSYTLILAASYGCLILFNVIGPYLIENKLHFSTTVFGHVALILGLAWFAGSTINRFLPRSIQIKTKLYYSTSFTLLAACVMVALAFNSITSLTAIILPLFCVLIASSITFTICFSQCISMYPEIAGAASSIMGCIFVSGAALAGFIASVLKASDQQALAQCYVAIAIFVLLFAAWVGLKLNRQGAS